MNYEEEGFALKLRLSKLHLTRSWLLAELSDKGIDINKSILSKCMNGHMKNDLAEKVITTSNQILSQYELYINEI